jgi:Ty3 transposon capsid-like protein/Zinc knuckle
MVIRTWLYNYKKFCSFYNLNDAQMITMVASYLTDEAGLWWEACKTWVGLPPVVTWELFEREFRQEFEPQDYQYDLRAQWYRLYQNNKTVYEYLSEWRKLRLLMKNMTEYDALYHFVTHLRPEIAQEVMKASPNDINAAVRLAQNHEDIHNRFNKGKKKDNTPNPNQKKKNPQDFSKYYNDHNGVAPMDLDSVNLKVKLTPKERKHLQSLGACFICKQVGHTAKQCKKNPSNPAGGPSQPHAPMYAAYPALPQYNHKVSRQALGLHNVETETDPTIGSGSGIIQGNAPRQ